MSLIACNNAFISNSNKILKGASSNIRGDISMLPGPSEILISSGIQQYQFDKSTGNEGDKKFPEDIAIKSIRNGYYQHIYWLGVGGYLIINHHDKEFILIDPWHSYLSFWLNDFPFTINRPLNPNPRIDEVTRLLYESIHVQNGLNNQYDEWMNCLAIYRERVSSKVPLQSFEILNMDLIAINEKTKGNSSSQGNKYFERKSYIDELSHMVTSTIDGCLRLTDLANFIRNSVNLKPDGSCDYTFSGILLSHMHFDHGDDLAMLLTLLCVGGGHYVDALTNLDFGILQGPALIQKKPDGTDVNHMPKIYCDFETIFYYKTMYFGVEPGPNVHPHYQKFIETFTNYNFYKNKYGESRLNAVYGGSNEKWYEIVAKKKSLFYTDGTNFKLTESKHPDKCPPAGTMADEFKVGSFKIIPYIWDHMNTGAPWQKDETNVENMSAGSYERITAFLIQRVDVKDAKRTFVVGSSGEMGKVIGKKWVNKGDTTLKEDWQIDHWVETAYVDDDYTFDHLQNINPQIETDLLIQAIQGNYMPVFSDFTYQVMASWKYILSNVNIHDAIVVSHWESYVQFIAKKHQSADLFDKDIRHDMRIVNQNIDMLRTIAFYPGTDVVFGSFTSEQLKRLISDRRIYILGRLGHDFEYDVPLNAERAFLEIKQETVSI